MNEIQKLINDLAILLAEQQRLEKKLETITSEIKKLQDLWQKS